MKSVGAECTLLGRAGKPTLGWWGIVDLKTEEANIHA